MPKFMTYQRPTPVNKDAWMGRSGTNPHRPGRNGKTVPAVLEATRPTLRVILPTGFKSS